MPRPFPLQLVLDLTERRAEARSREVKLAHAKWLQARTQVVRIQQQRARFNDRLSLRLEQGVASGLASEACEILGSFHKRLTAGMKAIESSHAAWQRTLETWQTEKRKLEALQVLAQRHVQDEARRDERQERRLHDELASKAAHMRMSSENRETGFMFSEAKGLE